MFRFNPVILYSIIANISLLAKEILTISNVQTRVLPLSTSFIARGIIVQGSKVQGSGVQGSNFFHVTQQGALLLINPYMGIVSF